MRLYPFISVSYTHLDVYKRQGLNHARGKYHLCIDADTLYPPQYISTMIKVLQDKEVAGAYALWSFLPNEHHLGLRCV